MQRARDQSGGGKKEQQSKWVRCSCPEIEVGVHCTGASGQNGPMRGSPAQEGLDWMAQKDWSRELFSAKSLFSNVSAPRKERNRLAPNDRVSRPF